MMIEEVFVSIVALIIMFLMGYAIRSTRRDSLYNVIEDWHKVQEKKEIDLLKEINTGLMKKVNELYNENATLKNKELKYE